MNTIKTFAIRLHPGQDLKIELDSLAKQHDMEAAYVITCVGSLTRAVLRYANLDLVTLNGPFEIVSLTGTLSRHGSHYHIAISDSDGRTYGGHLKEGCKIHTTAEIILGILPGLRFTRVADDETGCNELEIENIPSS